MILKVKKVYLFVTLSMVSVLSASERQEMPATPEGFIPFPSVDDPGNIRLSAEEEKKVKLVAWVHSKLPPKKEYDPRIQQVKKSTPQFWCEVCHQSFTHQVYLNAHIKGAYHRSRVQNGKEENA